MRNNELIKNLFKAFAKDDKDEFHRLAKEYICIEERKKHNIVVKELKEILYNSVVSNNRINGYRYKSNIPIPRDTEKGFPLLEIKEFNDLNWDFIILNKSTKLILNQIIKEYRESEILATYNLKPKNKILFCGKPGTGKTFTAQIMSSLLGLPLVYIRFDSIISSYLGETATNLRKVFDFIQSGYWIILFDEFDIIGKNRDDHHEHGEIKRVVNNFLQMMDSFEGDSLIISATNHQHLLDSAIWRRFDEVVYFDLPNAEQRLKLFELYLKPKKKNIETFDKFINFSKGFSASDIRLICTDALKKSIIEKRDKIISEDLEYCINRFIERNKIKLGEEVSCTNI